MNVLFDTNILTRAAQRSHPQHNTALEAGDVLKNRGDELLLVPQVLYEFWVVCTRPPGENGLGLTTRQTHAELARLTKLFGFRADTPDIYPVWENLVNEFDVRGKSAHDARLVAAMKVHAIQAILSFDTAGFSRYPSITVINPDELVREISGRGA